MADNQLADEMMGLDDIGVLTPSEIETRIRWVARELVLAVRSASDLPERIADAEAAYIQAYHQAHMNSTVDHPERKVGVHKSAAELASVTELRTKVLVTEERRIRAATIESYRAVLNALQSQLKSANGVVN